MVVVRTRPTGATASLPPDGPGTVTGTGGTSVRLAGTPSMEGMSPLELLDAALAGCLALSIRIAARPLGLAARLGAVTVRVEGHKSEETPNRIERQTCRFSIGGDLTAEDRARLIAEAHRLCTVGNSLSRTVVIEDGPPLD